MALEHSLLPSKTGVIMCLLQKRSARGAERSTSSSFHQAFENTCLS